MSPIAVLPDGWPRPRGYSNGMIGQGRLLAIAGLIGWDATETLVSKEFAGQFRQALANVAEVLKAAGGSPEHLISITVYVTDKHEYLGQLEAVGQAWRDIVGRHYPAMALLEVADLLENGAMVEIEATAVLP